MRSKKMEKAIAAAGAARRIVLADGGSLAEAEVAADEAYEATLQTVWRECWLCRERDETVTFHYRGDKFLHRLCATEHFD